MKKKNLSGKAIFSKQFMATVSVMIVLLILGLFGVAAIGAGEFSHSLKSRMGFTIVMNDDASDKTVTVLQKQLASAPYINTVTLIPADDVLARWTKDTGENPLDILGVNPFGDQFDVTVNEQYARADSIGKIASMLKSVDGVEEVSTTTEVIDVVNHWLDVASMVLIPLSLALLLVSAVLINNTVRLTVYSSRFLIHTMKLVGATGSFIRRPFIRTAVINGIVAGVVASALLALLIMTLDSSAHGIKALLPWSAICWLFPAMIVMGILICSTSAAMATNRYLRLDYDDMF